MKIKVKELCKGLYIDRDDLFINAKGDCIDLRAAEDYEFNAPQAGRLHQKENIKTRDVMVDAKLIKLGIAMQLPKGFVAKIRQRSSMTKKRNLLMATSGFIDTTYCGDTDEWGLYCIAIGNATIKKGDRICQFEVVPSQFATVWQKLKWLFSNKIKFEWVDNLGNADRGGHGSTGLK